MAAAVAGVVRVVGRFPAGVVVALIKVAGPHVLTAAGGRTLERRRVDEGGAVEFDQGIEVGERFFVTGYVDGHPVEVRAVAVENGDDAVASQPPVTYEPRKFGDGTPVPEVVSDEKLDEELEDEGDVDPAELKGQALKDKARDLNIEGRGSMSAKQLRAAIKKAV